MFSFEKKIFDICNKAIIITGSARSGTTILGKVLHSFNNVVYDYEPPVLISLIPQIKFISKKSLMFLYETYLYEEILMNTLAGRRFNFNKEDDSSIFKVKSSEYINSKISRSIRKSECEKMALDYKLIYKIPDISHYIPSLEKYYPETRTVFILRNPIDVINSLVVKNWFTNETLSTGNIIYPYRYYKDIQVPFFVFKGDEKKWYCMDEINRAAYSFISGHKDINKIKNVIIVRYEDMIANPDFIISGLAKKLKIEYGNKTQEIIKSIKIMTKEKNLNILNNLTSSNLKGIEAFCDKFNYNI